MPCSETVWTRKRVVLKAKLEDLLRPYVSGHAVQLDMEFHRKVSKSNLGRLAKHPGDSLEGLRGKDSKYPR